MRGSWIELREALFPRRCPLCSRAADPRRSPGEVSACDAHRLPSGLLGNRCGLCAERLPLGIPNGAPCVECRGRSPSIRGVVALGEYRRGEPLREWILALKHGGRRDLAPFLARALVPVIAASPTGRGLLAQRPLFLSVPLHPTRRLERGFDQARLLGRELADRLGQEFFAGLRRHRVTLPQGHVGVPSRRANVEGAFALATRARRVIEGRTLALVDDVVTSGATVQACASTLRRGGARAVIVVALARASRLGPVSGN